MLAAVVIVLEVVWASAIAAHADWLGDDFINLSLGRTAGFGAGNLLRSVYGVLSPGYQLTYSLLALASPVPRWPVVAITAVSFGAYQFFLWKLLCSLFGKRICAVPLLAVGGIGVVLGPSAAYFPAAINLFPGLAGTTLCLWMFVEWRRHGGRRQLLTSVLGLVLAMCFYDPCLVLIFWLMAFTMLYTAREPGLRGALHAWTSARAAWGLYAIPIALDAAWRFTHLAEFPLPPLAGPVVVVQFLGETLVQALMPAMLGWNVLALDRAGRSAVEVVGVCLLAAVVVLSIRRRPSAWRAWVFLAVGFFVTTGMPALLRAGIYGLSSVFLPPYLAFGPLLLALTLGLALLPHRPLLAAAPARAAPAVGGESAVGGEAEDDAVAVRPRRAHHRRNGATVPWAPIAGAALVGVTVVAALFEIPGTTWVSETNQAGAYERTVSASWNEPAAARTHAFVWDGPVPDVLALGLEGTANNVAWVLAGGVRLDQTEGEGYVMTAAGFVPARTRVWTTALHTPGAVVAPGAKVATTDRGTCVTTHSAGAQVELVFPRKIPLSNWWVRFAYTKSSGYSTVVYASFVTTDLRPGSGTAVVPLRSFQNGPVNWFQPPGARICITSATLEQPVVVSDPRAG